MIDDKTLHLELPLPHKDNQLSDDVGRLREALAKLDVYSDMLKTAVDAAAAQASGPIDASRILGMLDISHIPSAALEDLITVDDDAARYALTPAAVHLGMSVRVLKDNQGTAYDPPKLYIIKDITALDRAEGYREYSMVVRWEDVQGKPIGTEPTEGDLVVYGPDGTVPTSRPIASGDAANKDYVDTAIAGIDIDVPAATAAMATAAGQAGIVALAADNNTTGRDV
jgi:hypothetical protein